MRSLGAAHLDDYVAVAPHGDLGLFGGLFVRCAAAGAQLFEALYNAVPLACRVDRRGRHAYGRPALDVELFDHRPVRNGRGLADAVREGCGLAQVVDRAQHLGQPPVLGGGHAHALLPLAQVARSLGRVWRELVAGVVLFVRRNVGGYSHVVAQHCYPPRCPGAARLPAGGGSALALLGLVAAVLLGRDYPALWADELFAHVVAHEARPACGAAVLGRHGGRRRGPGHRRRPPLAPARAPSGRCRRRRCSCRCGRCRCRRASSDSYTLRPTYFEMLLVIADADASGAETGPISSTTLATAELRRSHSTAPSSTARTSLTMALPLPATCSTVPASCTPPRRRAR